MSASPISDANSLRIGTIDFVSPDDLKVLLDVETPDALTLNGGTPRPFPRINGYVLVPTEEGHLVAQIEWITIERSQYPKRRGMQDFGLVDLPYPLRKLSLNPLGCLIDGGTGAPGARYEFRRGVEAFPTVGDPVLVPTQVQLRAIVESGEGGRVKIGTSPLAGNADVRIDPDRLFGRHLAVLGNTGSGKSCSVAGIIRWSLASARKVRCGTDPNARFIVLDPNGEYTNTFRDMGKVRTFAVEAAKDVKQLNVPLWFWNSAEWSAFTQASARTQRPTLTHALRSVRDGEVDMVVTPSREMRRFLRTLVDATDTERKSGSPWGSFPRPKNFLEKVQKWEGALVEHASFTDEESGALKRVKDKIADFVAARGGKYPHYDFTKGEVDEFVALLRSAHVTFGGSDSDVLPIDADVPRPFTGAQLLRSVQASAELLNVSEYIETMVMRIQTILSDSRMKSVTGGADAVTLAEWLAAYIGGNQASNGSITVIDLSLVPADVVHIITAVIARVTLEALQRYRKLNHGATLPTVLVMEEAHVFVRRYADDAETQNSAAICCQVFEKIAREGRKFGLGLVVSSQRPSELSPTVLSQCNSYLLHRIGNDRDQQLVHRFVPDNLRGLLRDLPSLPSRSAILMGWASELPVLVKIDALPEAHRPKSDDPEFWAVWTGRRSDEDGQLVSVPRDVDWTSIADDWQRTTASSSAENNQSSGAGK